jgi:NitT/TauT family transport system permease protein
MPAFHPSLIALRRPQRFLPSVWDTLIFALVIGGLVLVSLGGRQTFEPLDVAARTPISLDPLMLPEYALRTTMRMLAGIIASLVFTFGYGALAVKSRRAETVLVPLLDILQSIPVMSFLAFTTTFFVALFPGQILGFEFAAIFAIFTGQAWNMTFSFYQSLKTVPRDLDDVANSLRLGAWRKFWTLEVPFAAPGLIWNTMMSMSGTWFFVTVSEAITVGDTTISLPGVGSYVALAIAQKNLGAVGWAVLAMAFVILLYDQLLFRPLVAWAEKFRVELSVGNAPPPRSWLLNFIQRAEIAQRVWQPIGAFAENLMRLRFSRKVRTPQAVAQAWSSRWFDWVWFALIAVGAAAAALSVVNFVGREVTIREVVTVCGFGVLTLIRVLVLIAVASVIWTPIGVWVGLRPRWAEAVQPIAQFLAAFPSNLLFPLFVFVIVRYRLMPDIWLSPLMILGTQWYILFNVIAGASAFPNDLREAAASFGVKGWAWWRKVALPGVFPYYVTGAITASGGAWNASIVAEVASWGSTRIEAHGLGSYIADATAKADMPRIVLGTAVISIFVVLFNRILWRPLFAFASKRLRLD